MCQTYTTNKLCSIILLFATITFVLNGVIAAPQFLSALNNRRHRPEDENVEGERFPFGNRPGQQIFDRIRTNINSNLENLGSNLGHALQNTYGFLNKTFENLNHLSMGNFGINHRTTSRPTFPVEVEDVTQPIIDSTTSRHNNDYQSTSSVHLQDDNNVDHYIDGQFPVILLKTGEIRK